MPLPVQGFFAYITHRIRYTRRPCSPASSVRTDPHPAPPTHAHPHLQPLPLPTTALQSFCCYAYIVTLPLAYSPLVRLRGIVGSVRIDHEVHLAARCTRRHTQAGHDVCKGYVRNAGQMQRSKCIGRMGDATKATRMAIWRGLFCPRVQPATCCGTLPSLPMPVLWVSGGVRTQQHKSAPLPILSCQPCHRLPSSQWPLLTMALGKQAPYVTGPPCKQAQLRALHNRTNVRTCALKPKCSGMRAARRRGSL